jgi:flavin-dependent thymidylate synthase
MSLSVRLAGYNVDAELLQDVLLLLRELESGGASGDAMISVATLRALAEMAKTNLPADAFTPETISAAYARISRDPKHVTELRRAARMGVARARKSNESIIFGLGHASVAEHAAFNFDVSGISRLASEELQSHRLLSFTEKSQRYITISAEYVVPPEVVGTPHEMLFHEAVPELFQAYDEITSALTTRYVPGDATELSKQETRDLENRAKEDARYLLPLACSTQMGMTMNARNVEHVALELSDHPLQEVRELGAAIATAVGSLAPSLVKYTVRGQFPRENRRILAGMITRSAVTRASDTMQNGPRVRLVDMTPDGETKILRALAFSSSDFPAGEKSFSTASHVWKTALRNLSPHDSVLREFEMASMTFEAEVSASCFAQLKRHRMMTLLSQPYDADASVVVPPSIQDAGLTAKFMTAVERSRQAARTLAEVYPLLMPYLLTNAHVKRVLIHANARELYHFARLRCDAHAQWEIRLLGEQVMELARREWPNVFSLACGKDHFETAYQKLFPET